MTSALLCCDAPVNGARGAFFLPSGPGPGLRSAPPSMSHESEPTRPGSSALAFVCWRGGDGARVDSCPMERERAEALAQAYAQVFPRQSYWVETVPWLEP